MAVPDGSVVVGVDGSPSALDAVRWAAAEAHARDLPLRLVHAYRVTASGYDDHPAAVARCRAQGEVWLREAAKVAASTALPGVPVTALCAGDTRTVLLRESRRAVLVVLGSRGLGSVSRLLLGSAGLTLAMHAPCPVVVVPGAAPARGQVVVSADGWPECRAAARFAFAQAASYRTGVTAVRTWLAAGHDGSAFAHERERATLREQLVGLATEFPDVPVEYLVVRDRPGHALLSYARHARLVVVSPRGHGGFAALLAGAEGQAVARHSACPVAVVRAEPDYDRFTDSGSTGHASSWPGRRPGYAVRGRAWRAGGTRSS